MTSPHRGIVSDGDWDAERLRLPATVRAWRIADVAFPARLHSYATAHGLVTVGDLAARSGKELTQSANLARGTVANLLPVLNSHADRIARDREIRPERGLLAALRVLVSEFDARLREILTRRAGLDGPAETLLAVGASFGLTREGVRQTVARWATKVVRRPWAAVARARIDSVLSAGVVPLRALPSAPFWRDAASSVDPLRFVVEDVLCCGCVVEDGGEWYLSRVSQAELASRRRAAFHALHGTQPVPKAEALRRFAIAAGDLPPDIVRRWSDEAEAKAIVCVEIDRDGQELWLPRGATRWMERFRFLDGLAQPVTSGEYAERFGTNEMPDDAVLFDDGRWGTRRHFPDFESWRRRLVPDAEAIVRAGARGRQWSTADLLARLQRTHDVPPWLGRHCLYALIKAGSALRPLGRARVTLDVPGAEERRHMKNEIVACLVAAGSPVEQQELVQRARRRTGASLNSCRLAVNGSVFVRFDDGRIGLLDRDVPGGARAIAVARDHVERVFLSRQEGLASGHVVDLVRLLSRTHARWDEAMVISVLRGDRRFRLSKSGSLGLRVWESVRCPRRADIVAAALAASRGRVTVADLRAALELHAGRPLRNAAVFAAVTLAGAVVQGGWVTPRE